MNRLEAIELMKQGSQVSDGEYVYKIENNLVLVRSLNGKLFNIDNSFDFTSEYEEYIEPKPLTGWERVDGKMYNVIVVNDLGKSMIICIINKPITSQLKKKQRRSSSSKGYSVSYNVSVMKMVEMRLIGRIPTKKSTVFYIATALKNCSPILLGFAKIKDKFTSFQKKSQKKPSCYSMMN